MVLGKYDSYRPPEKKSSLDHRDEYDDDHDQVAWDRGRDDRSRDERRDVYRDSDPAVYNSENFSLNRRRSAAISNDTFAPSPVHPDRLRSINTSFGADSADATAIQYSPREYKIKGTGAASVGSPFGEQQDTAIMTPPVKSPYSFSMGGRSGRTSPRPQQPSTSSTPTAASPSAQDFMKAFSEYTQSVVDIALVQTRCNTLSQDERRQKEEHDRWSKYHSSLPAIGEDHTRTLETIQKAKQQSEQTLSQAEQKGENAMKIIADSMLAASSGRLPVVVNNAASKKATSKQREEITDLWKEIDKLKVSNVNARSDHHHLHEIAEQQKRHEEQIDELWNDSIRRPVFRDLEADVERTSKKVNELSSASNTIKKELLALRDQSNGLTNLISKQDAFIKDVSNKIDAWQSDTSISQTKTLRDELDKTRESLKPIESACDRLDAESSTRNAEIQSLQQFKTEADSTLKDTAQRLEQISQICSSLQNKPQAKKNELSKLETNLKTHEQKLTTQAAALKKLETMVTNDTAKGSDLRKDIQDARNVLETFQNFIDSCTDEFQKVRTEQSSIAARIGEVELKRSEASDEASKNTLNPPPTEMTATQNCASLRDLEDRIQANSDNLEKMQNGEVERDEMVSREIDELHTLYIKQKAACEEQFRTQKGSINQLVNEQALVSASTNQIKAEMDSLTGVTNSLSRDRDAQQPFWDQLSTLQKQFQEFQKPIHAQPAQPSLVESSPVKDELQPKIEGLTDKVKAMESILATQESRWNNMTTEPMVSNVVYRMRQLYPSLQHIQNDIGQIKARQDQLTMEYTQWMQTVQRTHDEDKDALEFVRVIAQTTVSAHEELKCRIKTDLQDLQQRLAALESQKLGASTQSAMDALASLRAEFLHNLNDKISTMQREYSDLAGSFSNLRKDITSQTNHGLRDQDSKNIEKYADSKDVDSLRMKVNVVQDHVNDILALRGELEALQKTVTKLDDRKSLDLADATLDKIAKNVAKRLPDRSTPNADSRSSTPKNDPQALQPSHANVKELKTSVHALAKGVDSVKQNLETRTDEFYQAQKDLRTTTDSHETELQALKKTGDAIQTIVDEVREVLKQEIVKFEQRIKSLESRMSGKKAGDTDGVDDDKNKEVDETQEHFVSAPEDDDSSSTESDSSDEPFIPNKKENDSDSEDEPIKPHPTKKSSHRSSSPILRGEHQPFGKGTDNNNKSNKPRKRARVEVDSSDSYSDRPTTPSPTNKKSASKWSGGSRPPKKRGAARPGSGRPKKV